MAKGAVITADVRSTITDVFIKHPGWRAKEIRKEVNERLRNTNLSISPDWPGLSAVQKGLAKLRKTYPKVGIDDKDLPYTLEAPWTLETLWKHEISAEALPTVIKVWAYLAQRYGRLINIREAKLVSRLYLVIEDLDTLALLSCYFATKELISEVTYEIGEIPSLSKQLENNTVLYSLMTGKQFLMKYQEDLEGKKVYFQKESYERIREIVLEENKLWIELQEVGHERPHSQTGKE